MHRTSRTALGRTALFLITVMTGEAGVLADWSLGAFVAHAATSPGKVTALGRIEPGDGIIRVAGPSRVTVVIARLLVEEGDTVGANQPIAVLDTLGEHTARVRRLEAELRNARALHARQLELYAQRLAPEQLIDDSKLQVEVAQAELAMAQAELDRDTVRSPVHGEIIAIHARSGERVGELGIAEIADTERMYVVAEVYETDVGRVAVGQRAIIESPALAGPLTGRVERVGRKVGRQNAFPTDPAARTDARVVEVRILLDDGHASSGLSNLQVDVAIEPTPP
jgi:HlyD family secretion protein